MKAIPAMSCSATITDMARKHVTDLKPKQRDRIAAQRSWAVIGWDTSMTAVSAVCVAYDGLTDTMKGPVYGEIRWMPEDDYFARLGDASRAHDLALDLLKETWVMESFRVYMAFEEPVPFGMIKKSGMSGWIKQQCEVAGAVKGSLVRYGFKHLYEINNSQWRKTLRDEGVAVRKGAEGKWDVKTWAIKAFGLPDLPDLVKSKSGAKIPRPKSGFGAKAKAVQPNDIYDAAAVCAWMQDNLPPEVLYD